MCFVQDLETVFTVEFVAEDCTTLSCIEWFYNIHYFLVNDIITPFFFRKYDQIYKALLYMNTFYNVIYK